MDVLQTRIDIQGHLKEMAVRTGTLLDGLVVEIVSEGRDECGFLYYQVKPVGKDSFDSGVNPWVRSFSIVLDESEVS